MSRRLKLGVNASLFRHSRLRGFNRHARSLLSALRRREDCPEIHLFTDAPFAPEFREELRGYVVHQLSVAPHLAWEQVVVPVQSLASGIEVFHSPAMVGIPLPLPRGFRRVVTVHDLITVRVLAERFDPLRVSRLKESLRFHASWAAALTADAIITGSEHSYRDLVARYPRLAPRVRVIPNGVDACFSPGRADSAVLQRWGLQPPFFLYVGGFERHKNVTTLIEAFRRLESGTQAAALALVGHIESEQVGLRSCTAAVPGVRWLGYVPDEDLVHLYRQAVCAVVPSLDEGFGFPVLEAMACGCAVLCSNAASLPEVAGEAATYFDPRDQSALTFLLQRALTEPSWLASLRARGLKRAAEFSWDRTAECTMSLYRELTDRGHRSE